MNSNILYEIGFFISDPKTFFNYIVAFKDVTNKVLLIKQKKEQFKKEIHKTCLHGGKRFYVYPNGHRYGQCLGTRNGFHFEYNYNKSMKEGRCVVYDINGIIREEYIYVNNKIDGFYFGFDIYGNIKYEIKYNRGKREYFIQKLMVKLKN